MMTNICLNEFINSAATRRMMWMGVILQPGAVAPGYKRMGANAPSQFHRILLLSLLNPSALVAFGMTGVLNDEGNQESVEIRSLRLFSWTNYHLIFYTSLNAFNTSAGTKILLKSSFLFAFFIKRAVTSVLLAAKGKSFAFSLNA